MQLFIPLMVCANLAHFGGYTSVLARPERSTILWITCEYISPYLGCYGYMEAKIPNLDRLEKLERDERRQAD
jgi:hypothetical protein